jgi:hypothetical protein
VTEIPLPLTEINKWDLEDIRKASAVLDMKIDMEDAVQFYMEQKDKK